MDLFGIRLFPSVGGGCARLATIPTMQQMSTTTATATTMETMSTTTIMPFAPICFYMWPENGFMKVYSVPKRKGT